MYIYSDLKYSYFLHTQTMNVSLYLVMYKLSIQRDIIYFAILCTVIRFLFHQSSVPVLKHMRAV